MLSYEPFLGVADPPSDHHQVSGRAPAAAGPGQDSAGSGGGAVTSGSEPMFAGPIQNVTVNVGREAVLECHVNNLRAYKVKPVWPAPGGS